MTRNERLRALVDSRGFGLEIGPSHAPVFPRAAGFNVETLDHADADELRRKYAAMGVDTSAIEGVAYVSDGGPIHEIVPRRGEYDFVFSSHVIEHVTDFVGYFESCEALLKSGGCALLVIPDKRYVFDALRFPSTTGDILEAWNRRDRRHSPARVFDFHASYSTFGGQPVWEKSSRGDIVLSNPLAIGREMFEAACSDDRYIDAHGWAFTPASFRLIVRDLNEMGLINLKIAQIVQDGTSEFIARLTREAAPDTLPRAELILDVHREQFESSLQMILGSGRFSVAA